MQSQEYLINDKWAEIFDIPKNLFCVSNRQEIRNGDTVKVIRFQEQAPIRLGYPHVTFVVSTKGDQLLSYKNNIAQETGPLTISQNATVDLAEEVMEKVDGQYARHLSYIRTERQSRIIGSDNSAAAFPVYWVKFGHANGSYNWVTLAESGTVIEYEINSFWDFARMRRKTEMWDTDEWVLARIGQGPELPSPAALARI